jgi:hypothetical protein
VLVVTNAAALTAVQPHAPGPVTAGDPVVTIEI